MRPRLHRAAKIRLISRLGAFAALVLVFVLSGILGAMAQAFLAVTAFAVLVMPVAIPLIKPSRSRTTMPRTLASPTA